MISKRASRGAFLGVSALLFAGEQDVDVDFEPRRSIINEGPRA
jgi:hypothetical protein